MSIDDQLKKTDRNADTFLATFEQLLARKKIELDTPEISSIFEVIATNLLSDSEVYFDGAAGLSARIRKSRQIEFVGKMWVGGNQTQWLEPLNAVVTDKTSTKQGIWFRIRVGEDEAEGTLAEAFNLSETPVNTI